MNSVFIIDDHPVIRMAVRMLWRMKIMRWSETDNGVDAMQMVRECMPDLIILDISIPKLDGLEVLARFNTMGLPSKILVLTSQTPTCLPFAACNQVPRVMCASRKTLANC